MAGIVRVRMRRRITTALVAAGMAAMVSACSVGPGLQGTDFSNYLWGDTPEPAAAARQPTSSASAGANALPTAPNIATASTATRTSVFAANNNAASRVKVPKGTQRVVVVVNDQPITDYDINERMRLNQALGYARGSAAQQRKAARQQLIDDIVKLDEAKRLKITPTSAHIDATIQRLAKGSNTTVEGLTKKLKAKGVSMKAFRKQVKANMAFRVIVQRLYNLKFAVSEAEVDRRFAAIANDPRMRPVHVYQLRQIDLPVEKAGAMYGQLLQARAIEAQQIKQRYKGCASLRRASSGIFNVKISRMIDAAAERMPPQMRKALRATGTRSLLGPMRSPVGIRLIAFCGSRSIKPKAPSRAMVKNLLLNEKYARSSKKVMRDLRRRAFIDQKTTG